MEEEEGEGRSEKQKGGVDEEVIDLTLRENIVARGEEGLCHVVRGASGHVMSASGRIGFGDG